MQSLFNIIKENIRLLLGAAVVTFIGILLISFILSRESTGKVLINNQAFKVTVARSEKERQIGLSNTEQLNENQGMLFLFDRSDYHSFWMKNMKFPIDIIYINGDKVVTVIENAKPASDTGGNLEIYQPTDKSDKVLEISAGLAKKYNIKRGTSVNIENL